MDYVKTYFADLLQTSSHQSVSVKNDAKVIEKPDDCPLLERFCSPGWALPKRQVVRFSLGQWIFLYNEFIIGEESGRKTTAEKVIKKMCQAKNKDETKRFQPSEYLTIQQVTSASSRMSALFRKGKLKQPELKNENTDVVVNNQDECAVLEDASLK